MGGGDLNLKKSWHPKLEVNQKRVWEEEMKALEERKKTSQRVKELQEERQIHELQQMQEAAGGKKRVARVDWMYSGPSSGQLGATEEVEKFLLGNRNAAAAAATAAVEAPMAESAPSYQFTALQDTSAKDTTLKIQNDPMLAMRRQEQAAFDAAMSDPTRRKALMIAAGKDNDDPRTSDSRHDKRKRRRDDSERDGHSRDRHRERNGHLSDRHSSRRERHDRSRERHSYKRERHYDDRERSDKYERNGHDRSERRERHYEERERSYKPERHRDDGERRDDSRERSHKERRVDHDRPQNHRNGHSNGYKRQERAVPSAEEKAAKLAAMQSAASELDSDRKARLEVHAKRDEEEREKENAMRLQSSKNGGKGDFVMGLHRKAGELDIGARMNRGKARLERDND